MSELLWHLYLLNLKHGIDGSGHGKPVSQVVATENLSPQVVATENLSPQVVATENLSHR